MKVEGSEPREKVLVERSPMPLPPPVKPTGRALSPSGPQPERSPERFRIHTPKGQPPSEPYGTLFKEQPSGGSAAAILAREVVVEGEMQSSPSQIRAGSVPAAFKRIEPEATPAQSVRRDKTRSRSSPAGNQSGPSGVPAPPLYEPFLSPSSKSPESSLKSQTEKGPH